jgi:hypothetical protein
MHKFALSLRKTCGAFFEKRGEEEEEFDIVFFPAIT